MKDIGIFIIANSRSLRMPQQRWIQYNILKPSRKQHHLPQKITKQFKKQKGEVLSVFMGLKMLKETAIMLLAIEFSERILLQVAKRFLKGVSRTYVAVTEAYERSKKWEGFEENILKRRARLYACERRGIKFGDEI